MWPFIYFFLLPPLRIEDVTNRRETAWLTRPVKRVVQDDTWSFASRRMSFGVRFFGGRSEKDDESCYTGTASSCRRRLWFNHTRPPSTSLIQPFSKGIHLSSLKDSLDQMPVSSYTLDFNLTWPRFRSVTRSSRCVFFLFKSGGRGTDQKFKIHARVCICVVCLFQHHARFYAIG